MDGFRTREDDNGVLPGVAGTEFLYSVMANPKIGISHPPIPNTKKHIFTK